MIDAQPGKVDTGGYGELLLTWVVALGLLLALTWLIARFAGSWLAHARARSAASSRAPIRVLAQTALGGGQHELYVVEVGGKTLLLATAERGVSLLTEVDGAVVLSALDRAQQDGRRSFSELFQAALQRRGRAPGPWSDEYAPENCVEEDEESRAENRAENREENCEDSLLDAQADSDVRVVE